MNFNFLSVLELRAYFQSTETSNLWGHVLAFRVTLGKRDS